MSEFIDNLSKRLGYFQTTEHFTIPTDVLPMYNAQLDYYDQVRTGVYTTISAQEQQSINTAMEILLSKGLSLREALTEVLKGDVDLFVRNFEKTNDKLSTEALESKVKVTNFILRYVGVITSMYKENLVKGFPEHKVQVTEAIDAMVMIADSLYKAALFEQFKRKYMKTTTIVAEFGTGETKVTTVEGFTDAEKLTMDALVIELTACKEANASLKKPCAVCPTCPMCETKSKYPGWASILCIMFLIILIITGITAYIRKP